MARVAVIGAGIAGLSAAYHLREQADVTVFEKEANAGGHANSVEVTDAGRTLGLDTAFIVYNEPHYQKITQFFAELGVACQAHPGRFSFNNADTRTCYVSDDFELDEAAIRAKYPEDFVQLWTEAERFYRESPGHFIRKQAEMSLGEYLTANGYSDTFRYGFVVLVATAAWSVPADRIWDMPAATVIAFFLGHGREGLGGRTAPWRTVTGGSINYVRAVLERLGAAGQDIRLGTSVTKVAETAAGVEVSTGASVEMGTEAGTELFDEVIIALHADDALGVLAEPTPQQRMLEAIQYNTTKAALHTDAACMPADREQWRSWNYARSGDNDNMSTWVVYYLNQLHDFTSATDYFLTLDYPFAIAPERIIQEFDYRHPVFTTEARSLQSSIHTINAGDSRIKFAGSYFHSRKMGIDIVGSHESGFDSGAAAADAVVRSLSVDSAR
ncbi:NAD(P)/FAD-dependent oxidoreductase [Nocardia sp. NPDC059240]|uniref:NAD(P)/FAD-dependent oxidoreductase n=1 Tax=Nocardia sp. NPDC059240 TaxID=3346786 RepID=UPI0036B5F3AE